MFHIHTLKSVVFLWPTFSRSDVYAQAAAAPFDQTEAWTWASFAVCGSWIVPLRARKGAHTQDRVASCVWRADTAHHLCLIADDYFWEASWVRIDTSMADLRPWIAALITPMRIINLSASFCWCLKAQPSVCYWAWALGLASVWALPILMVALAFALSRAPRSGVSPLQQVEPREYEHGGTDTGVGVLARVKRAVDPQPARVQGQQI
jgi:hypothetical protein